MAKKTEDKNEWKEIKDNEDVVWKPERIGEEISGKYIRKEEDVGVYHSNKYTLENENGEIDVFGSTVLDSKFNDVPLGYEVKIIYQGEKPSTPPKKPFKLFQVFMRKP